MPMRTPPCVLSLVNNSKTNRHDDDFGTESKNEYKRDGFQRMEGLSMKMYIFAVVLVLGGLMCLFQPNNSESFMSGVFAMIVGIVIITFKSIQKRKGEEAAQHRRQQQQAGDTNTTHATYTFSMSPDSFDETYAKYEQFNAVQKRYEAVVKRHFELVEQIGVAYTIANNLSAPDSPEMDKVIDLCNEDIRLAASFKAYWEDLHKTGYYEEAYAKLPVYPSYKRLAIIYDKRKDYDRAISICQQAIELGYVDDGTDGQMPGRIARLMRKAGTQKKKLSSAETIAGSFSDDSDASVG